MSKTEIKLQSGVEISGALVKTITMREPTVGDAIAAQDYKGNSAAQEVAYIANLCEVSPAEIQSMTMRDYKRLQDALAAFTD